MFYFFCVLFFCIGVEYGREIYGEGEGRMDGVLEDRQIIYSGVIV